MVGRGGKERRGEEKASYHLTSHHITAPYLDRIRIVIKSLSLLSAVQHITYTFH
jgi:hypothetical protein